MELSPEAIDRVVTAALSEDVGPGDRTTEAVVPQTARCTGDILLKEPGIVCGLPLVEAVFRHLDEGVTVERIVEEGTRVDSPPTGVAHLEGPARAILTGERAALNLLGRLSGIATLTARYVEAVAGTGATILDTRKTTPGLRALEKYAVACGGGTNHRHGLYDAILLKENHLRIAGGVRAAVAAVGDPGGLTVEVEAETLDEVSDAVDAGVGRILLDNMTPDEIRSAVALVAGRAKLEASGGITLDTVRAFAETGVDYISVGALTHSARTLDVSLEIT